MNHKNNKYTKEKLKKDLKFLLSNLEGRQHFQNLLVNTVKQAISGVDGLIEDDSTVEEIKNSESLNLDFTNIKSYIYEIEKENKRHEKLICEIIKKFNELQE